MDIRKAGRKDIPLVTCLARQLWPNHTYEELLPEMQKAVLEPAVPCFWPGRTGNLSGLPNAVSAETMWRELIPRPPAF